VVGLHNLLSKIIFGKILSNKYIDVGVIIQLGHT